MHAAALSAIQWAPQAHDLGDTFRLHAVDIMADAGLSSQARLIRSRSAGADWLAAVLDGLGLERATLLGSSFGGFLGGQPHPHALHGEAGPAGTHARGAA